MSIKTKQFEAFSQMEFLHWNNISGQAMPYKTQFTWNFVIDGHVVCNFLVASITSKCENTKIKIEDLLKEYDFY